jgi:hypothetical protein
LCATVAGGESGMSMSFDSDNMIVIDTVMEVNGDTETLLCIER